MNIESTALVCTTHGTLIQGSHHERGVIMGPNSFVHRCEAVSVPEVQMSATQDQQSDALHRQAGLHGHAQRGL